MSLEDIYRRKCQLLMVKCEVLEQENDKISNRIRQMERVTKLHRKEVKLLKERLDKYKDPFRTIKHSKPIEFQEAKVTKKPVTKTIIKKNLTTNKNATVSKVPPKEAVKIPPKEAPKYNPKANTKITVKPTCGSKLTVTCKNPKDKDPNAPKKPCNAFFQFCQEQRPLIVSDPSKPEPSKQEVTRQLAFRWRALSTEDKKVYVAMFEKSKEKYNEEMSAYVKKEAT